MIDLYPYQVRCVEFALAHNYSINACEQGLGKTAMALETAKRSGLKSVVFGPAFLERTWRAEAEAFGVEILFVPYSRLQKKQAAHYEGPALEGREFWVADEVTYLKNPVAARTSAFHDLLSAKRPEYFLALSGTPIKNRVYDLWTFLAFCNLNPKNNSGTRLSGELVKYGAFSRRFCEVKTVKVNGRRFEKFGAVKPEMVNPLKELLRDKMIRFKVEDVLKDLPELTRKIVEVEAAPTAGLEDAFEAYLSGSKADPTAKARSALVKAPMTVEYCQTLQDGGSGPLLVFTDHVESAKLLADRLGVRPITGASPMHERMATVERFQAGRIPAVVATIGALSVGVTLTAARHVVFNDLSWVPSDNAQAEKRIHRIGQKNACFAHYIESTPTDAYIRKTLLEKSESISKVIS